jgi:hypothetical protein
MLAVDGNGLRCPEAALFQQSVIWKQCERAIMVVGPKSEGR